MEYIFNPTILECRYFVTQNSSYSPMRIVNDYEFDFYIDGERDMYIDDVHYKIGNGSLVIRTPGQKVYSKGDYNCYILTLDFSKRSLTNYKRNNATELQPMHNSPIWEVLPSVFTPAHFDDYMRIFKELTSINTPDINDNPNSTSLVNEFLHLALADAFKNNAPQASTSKNYIDDVCNYIKMHYPERITLDDLSSVAHINKNHLIRKFKDKLNISPIAYLIQYRLDISKRLLSKTDLPINSIAMQCGFSDYSYFCMIFKRTFSTTPAQYRAKKTTLE